ATDRRRRAGAPCRRTDAARCAPREPRRARLASSHPAPDHTPTVPNVGCKPRAAGALAHSYRTFGTWTAPFGRRILRPLVAQVRDRRTHASLTPPHCRVRRTARVAGRRRAWGVVPARRPGHLNIANDLSGIGRDNTEFRAYVADAG